MVVPSAAPNCCQSAWVAHPGWRSRRGRRWRRRRTSRRGGWGARLSPLCCCRWAAAGRRRCEERELECDAPARLGWGHCRWRDNSKALFRCWPCAEPGSVIARAGSATPPGSAPPAAGPRQTPSGCRNARRRRPSSGGPSRNATNEICASAATLVAAGRSVRWAAADIASGKIALVPTPISAKPSSATARVGASEAPAACRCRARRAACARRPLGCGARRNGRRRSGDRLRAGAGGHGDAGQERRGAEHVAHVDGRPVDAGAFEHHAPTATTRTSTMIASGRPGEAGGRFALLAAVRCGAASKRPSSSTSQRRLERHHQRPGATAARRQPCGQRRPPGRRRRSRSSRTRARGS